MGYACIQNHCSWVEITFRNTLFIDSFIKVKAIRTVLCAKLGGEESVYNQEEAKRLAKERGYRLVFTNIADGSFFANTTSAVMVDVDGELEKMADIFLTIAVNCATKSCLEASAKVQAVVIPDELIDLAWELEADLIVFESHEKNPGNSIRRLLPNKWRRSKTIQVQKWSASGLSI